MSEKLAHLSDVNQNFWQLTSIQVMTYGLASILVGAQIMKNSGVGTAYISLLIGNLILWAVGISMVFMSSDGRNNAIQNIGNYFGLLGAVIANIVLGVVFLIWYPINLAATVSALDAIIPNHFSMFNYLVLPESLWVKF